MIEIQPGSILMITESTWVEVLALIEVVKGKGRIFLTTGGNFVYVTQSKSIGESSLFKLTSARILFLTNPEYERQLRTKTPLHFYRHFQHQV